MVGAERVAVVPCQKIGAVLYEAEYEHKVSFSANRPATFGASATGVDVRKYGARFRVAKLYQFGAILPGAESLAIFLFSFHSCKISLRLRIVCTVMKISHPSIHTLEHMYYSL
jgi:hypothetical protein